MPNDGYFDNKIKIIILDVSSFSNGNVNQGPVKKFERWKLVTVEKRCQVALLQAVLKQGE